MQQEQIAEYKERVLEENSELFHLLAKYLTLKGWLNIFLFFTIFIALFTLLIYLKVKNSEPKETVIYIGQGLSGVFLVISLSLYYFEQRAFDKMYTFFFSDTEIRILPRKDQHTIFNSLFEA